MDLAALSYCGLKSDSLCPFDRDLLRGQDEIRLVSLGTKLYFLRLFVPEAWGLPKAKWKQPGHSSYHKPQLFPHQALEHSMVKWIWVINWITSQVDPCHPLRTGIQVSHVIIWWLCCCLFLSMTKSKHSSMESLAIFMIFFFFSFDHFLATLCTWCCALVSLGLCSDAISSFRVVQKSIT